MQVNFKTTHSPINYTKAINVMNRQVNRIINHNASNTVWFLQHHSVYTKGTSANMQDIIVNPTNIPVINTQRGGQITFHNPQQRVIYLMLKLKQKDIALYINTLQNWVIDTLNHFNVNAFTINNATGIWVGSMQNPQKISAIGIRVKKWVAYHGIAINVNNNLQPFNNINACGLQFKTTSLQQLKINVSLNQVDEILQHKFAKHFTGLI